MFSPSFLAQPARMEQHGGMTLFRPISTAYDRELLQMEEKRLTAALCVVRRNLNDTLPIYKLPPEIMEQIFQICVSWLYGPQKPKHRLAWTQVCHSWRIISLNSSKLWQLIDLADARLTEECLTRSKMAPLSIVSSSPVKLRSNAAADNLAPHAHRIRSIDVCLRLIDLSHLFCIVGETLPSLTYLSLKVPPSSSPSEPTLHLEAPLPFVRHLSLDGVSLEWEECRNLTHLEIRGLHPHVCPPISELHGVFARSPNLQYVRLVNFVTPHLNVNPGSPILLHDIKDMMISSEQAVISAILYGVKLGPSSRLRIHTSHLKESLFDLLPAGLPHATNPHAVIHIPTVRLSRNGIHLSQRGTPTWSDSQSIFSISSTEMSLNVCNSLRYLIALSSITKLELNTSVLMSIPKEDLSSLFANLYGLETLCTAFNDLEDLCSILQTSSPSGLYLYLPRLIHLSFSKPAYLWWHFADRWLSEITACVMFRKLHSHPIQCVEFFRCHGITALSTKQLKQIVPKVVMSDQMTSTTSSKDKKTSTASRSRV